MAMPRGFVSRSQWRWAMATHQPWAHKEAHKVIARRGKVTGYRSLPKRTTAIKGRRHI